MRFPEIEAIADVNRGERQLASEGCAIAISRWTETAMEIARDRAISIRHHYEPYRELSELGASVQDLRPGLRRVQSCE